jgi:hypothetical protein
MPRANREQVQALVGLVDGFYVRDRKMERAQAEMRASLAAGGELTPEGIERYLVALQRYFGGFEREAREHLRDVERRLAHASQVQFNLSAECGVAERRVEITQGVLAKLAELGG